MKEQYIIIMDRCEKCGFVYDNLSEALARFNMLIIIGMYDHITLHWSEGKITYDKNVFDGFIINVTDKIEWPT